MKHKWHKEIKAWADGAAIETLHEGVWKHVFSPAWTEFAEYRIKSQPKEPQYLYVYHTKKGIEFGYAPHEGTNMWETKIIGKIKLDSDNA